MSKKKYAAAMLRCCDNCGKPIPSRFEWLEAVIEICRNCVDNRYLDFIAIDTLWYWDLQQDNANDPATE